MIVTCVCDGYD
jgi:hypothetical protein